MGSYKITLDPNDEKYLKLKYDLKTDKELGALLQNMILLQLPSPEEVAEFIVDR